MSDPRPLPAGIPADIEIITSFTRYTWLRSHYGIPNAVDVGRGLFGTRGGILFVDDEDNGKPIAFGWPDGTWRTGL